MVMNMKEEMRSVILDDKNMIALPEEVQKWLDVRPGKKIEFLKSGEKIFIQKK